MSLPNDTDQGRIDHKEGQGTHQDVYKRQAYAPFEFKDSDQTYKGIDVEILDKVAEINGWDLDKSFPGFDAAVNACLLYTSRCV